MEKQQKTILLVDDNIEIRESYAQIFKDNDFKVLQANDGVEGLDIATSQEGIDIIFTGIVMPRMDGTQLMKSLKEYTNTAKIPVIINSHLGREEDRKEFMKLGARDFIVRDFVPTNEIFKRVMGILNDKKTEYNLQINFLELDGQKLIDDYKFPPDMKCANCGAAVILKAHYDKDNKITGHLLCPNCNKSY